MVSGLPEDNGTLQCLRSGGRLSSGASTCTCCGASALALTRTRTLASGIAIIIASHVHSNVSGSGGSGGGAVRCKEVDTVASLARSQVNVVGLIDAFSSQVGATQGRHETAEAGLGGAGNRGSAVALRQGGDVDAEWRGTLSIEHAHKHKREQPKKPSWL